MPSKVTHLTKIVDVKEVEFQGKLDYDIDDGWSVKGEAIDPWLWKLEGKHVRITIVNVNDIDDSEMLENTKLDILEKTHAWKGSICKK